MATKTLIIKLAALGDVLRTTPLLRVLEGEVYWVTKKDAFSLLPFNNNILKQVIDVNEAEESLKYHHFDMVLCLDDEYEAARVATIVNKDLIVGTFISNNGKLAYTESSAEWFDMGLVSKYGKETADELKKRNTKTYQEILFKMIGKKFSGEEYLINFQQNKKGKNDNPIIVGIESRAGERWPTKRWNKYNELADLLTQNGITVRFFQQQKTLHQYISCINECDLVITGDTLALHIALALKIKTVAIFTCTSPTEIYDYGRMVKVVSPLWEKAFYRRDYVYEAVDAISVDEVYEAVMSLHKC